MFLPSASMNLGSPFFDEFQSFFEFVDPSDTCSVDCGQYHYNHADDSCASTNNAPDQIFYDSSGVTVNYFDGGSSRFKDRSADIFPRNNNLDLSSTTWDICVKCWRSSGGNIVTIKNIHWSVYGSCEEKMPAIDHTLTSTNSYQSIA